MSEELIKVKVIPNAKREEVSPFADGLKVKVNAPAENNKANKAVIKLLAKYLKVKSEQLLIISGHKNQQKMVKLIK